MKNRPRINIELTATDRVFEILGWTSVLVIWILMIINYSGLPGTIPTHYNGAGEADGFGEKSGILILPIIATLLFVALTILNKYPQIFNYPTKITEKNALWQYTNATRMIRYLKFIIVIIFGFIEFQTIRNAKEQTSGLGAWFLPMIWGLTFFPMIFFLAKSFKKTK